MGRLILVRHAQASIHEEDYDQLSELGERQAENLARHWAESGIRLNAVYRGTLQRHRQTLEPMADAFAAIGLDWPEARVMEELDEHQGPEVFDDALPALASEDPRVAGWVASPPADKEARVRAYLELYRQVTLRWVRGRLPAAGREDWGAFRRRVEEGIEGILARARGEQRSGQTVLAVTSGGPVAAALGMVLELGDEKVLEASWVVRNTSVSEFLFSSDRFSLRTFNALPHLDPTLASDI